MQPEPLAIALGRQTGIRPRIQQRPQHQQIHRWLRRLQSHSLRQSQDRLTPHVVALEGRQPGKQRLPTVAERINTLRKGQPHRSGRLSIGQFNRSGRILQLLWRAPSGLASRFPHTLLPV